MGAKYIPSIKDLKANLRFHKKQLATVKSNLAPRSQAARKSKKK